MDQAERVVEIVRDVLGDSVIGAYLHGSAALGQLRPSSDIDILAVTEWPMNLEQVQALTGRLLPISGPGDPTGRSRSIDLGVVVQAQVRPWRYPPPLDFQYGDWLRPAFARGELTPWTSPEPDVALQISMAIAADHPLYGPRPAEVLDEVPAADLRRAMLDGIPVLYGDLDGDERNVVLTFARMWMTISTGVIGSKESAADWVLPRLPAEHRGVLEHARAIYLGEVPEEWGDLLSRVRPHVDHVQAQIRRV